MKRRRVIQSVYDPPIYLGDNEKLERTHIVRGGPEYGHILFKHSPCVEITGQNVVVRWCYIENLCTPQASFAVSMS